MKIYRETQDETPEESERGMAGRVVEGIMGETGDINTGDRGATSQTLLASDPLYYSTIRHLSYPFLPHQAFCNSPSLIHQDEKKRPFYPTVW